MSTLVKISLRLSFVLISLTSVYALPSRDSSIAKAQIADLPVKKIRDLEIAHMGVTSPKGLAYSPTSGALLVFTDIDLNETKPSTAAIAQIMPYEFSLGTVGTSLSTSESFKSAFDTYHDRLLILPDSSSRILELNEDTNGDLRSPKMVNHDTEKVNLDSANGIAVDPHTGILYIWSDGSNRLQKLEPDNLGSYANSAPVAIEVDLVVPSEISAMTVEPSTRKLFLLGAQELILYELDMNGKLRAKRDLSTVGLRRPSGMVFAPSSDLTDYPKQLSLYVAERANNESPLAQQQSMRQPEQAVGRIVEISIDPPSMFVESTATNLSALAAAMDGVESLESTTANLISTIDISQFAPSSPDPAGITFDPTINRLLVVDSEVNEMTIFEDANFFQSTLTGTLVFTANITLPSAFTNEPTGITRNPGNGNLFFSDDNQKRVFEVDLGPDEELGTVDDIVTSFKTSDFNSMDPEGITFDDNSGDLFIADGINNEIYRLSPGSNNRFDGVAPAGDDIVTSFDTGVIGISDPEGVAFDPSDGHLYIIGEPDTAMAHVTTGGALLRTIDIASVNASTPAGLGIAHSSQNSSVTHFYMTDRGVDNDSDPTENDGKVYELFVPPRISTNLPPVVNAGPNLSVTLPLSATLHATVTDDSEPDPPNTVTTNWIQVTGLGTVSFDDVSEISTSASFSIPGTYTLRLIADDSDLSASDDVDITVDGTASVEIVDIRVDSSSDDAEEDSDNEVELDSSDLEIVQDGEIQTVGIRFNNVTIPQASTIVNAYIQFQVDEASTATTSLTFQGEAVDSASTFTTASGNVTNRARTSASVNWQPSAWPIPGDVGLEQRTPDLTEVVQEIVDRSGWTSGNSLAIIISGTGTRTAEAYDGSALGAPLLHLEYNGSLPSTVTLISPFQSIMTTTPTFIWSVEPTATSYRLAVYNIDSATIEYSNIFTIGELSCDAECSISPEALSLEPGQYTWLVQAINDAGEGPWSTYSP